MNEQENLLKENKNLTYDYLWQWNS